MGIAYQYPHTNNSYIIETCLWASRPGLLRRKLLQQRPTNNLHAQFFYTVAVKPKYLSWHTKS
jgi:hypothetical protein